LCSPEELSKAFNEHKANIKAKLCQSRKDFKARKRLLFEEGRKEQSKPASNIHVRGLGIIFIYSICL